MDEEKKLLDRVARAICAETCATVGEMPCWRVSHKWDGGRCDGEPNCRALAEVAIKAMATP